MSNNNISKAIAWLNSSREFNEGIIILRESGFRPAVVRKLESVGENGPAARKRLEHNMYMLVRAKSADVEDTDAELNVFAGQESPVDVEMTASQQKTIHDHQADDDNLGKVARLYANAFKTRELAFKSLKEVGENNDEISMSNRKTLNETIDKASELMERLYPLYVKYEETGNVPSDDEVAAATDEDKESEKEDDEDDSDVHSQTNYDDMTKAELAEIKYSLTRKITRAKCMLLYQSENIQEVENPLPEGAKRVKYETKIAKLQPELDAVNIAIARKS